MVVLPLLAVKNIIVKASRERAADNSNSSLGAASLKSTMLEYLFSCDAEDLFQGRCRC
ncbi:unnamed protein product [Amoebophrya sp. A25]|nr:unnamed protein product [Amoebophrya sp. A25]|eukprot:GSA25T00027919001.1